MAEVEDLDDDDGPKQDKPMSLGEHLDELRRHLMRCVAYSAVCIAVAFYFHDSLMAVALQPVSSVLLEHELGSILADSPATLFFTTMKVIVVVGVFLAAPLIIWEIWRFVARGLYSKEKRWVRVCGPISYLLFVSGCLFFYFVIQPIALDFLLTFNTDLKSLTGQQIAIEVMPSISTSVGFFLSMVLVMGVIFELPLAMVFAQAIGVVDWETYAKYRRHFIMGSVVFAAVISPTGDAITLLLMMVPITVLFEGGIITCRILARRSAAA